MIKIKEGTINSNIIRFHGKWFIKKLIGNKEEIKKLYRDLSQNEQELYIKLLGLETGFKCNYKNIKAIKSNICTKDIKNLIKDNQILCKKLLRMENKEVVENKRRDLQKKPNKFNEMILFLETYKEDIKNFSEVKKKLEDEKKEFFDLRTKQIIFNESNFFKIINLTFGYSNMDDTHRHSLLTMIGIEVCPYCQRNYITNYKEDEKNKTTADLDHFYSKDEYPYLALSLYNFVPSCQICNRTFKLAKPSEDILYPYEESFDDYNVKFSLTENVIDNILDKETPFKVKINYEKNSDENKKRIKKTIDTFKLDKVYEESHNRYLKDMIENIEKYPKTYTKKLADIFLDKPEETEIEKFETYQEKLQILNDNFQEIIKKPYTDKIEKGEPLAKLTKDIMDELGIK